MENEAADIVAFWRSLGPEGWFRKDAEVDARCRDRFGGLVERAIAGELEHWVSTPEGSLALILLLDQFTRNIFRDDARAFAGDAQAVAVANTAIAAGHDLVCEPALRAFYFMPFMHAETIAEQDRCVLLMHAHGAPDNLKFARIHRDIIARFGRFPHRNPVLGRHTTPAEQAFLEEGGFKG